jgi:hypothetical protein
MNIRMSEKERVLLEGSLVKSTHYLEYGSGGSTLLACSVLCIRKIHSVESDSDFINDLSENNSITEGLKNKRLEFFYVDIGKTGKWGMPVDKKHMHLWPLYPLKPFNAGSKTSYDLVFIDGRFRVACALAVALENPSCTVLIHDYFKRPQYWILEKFYEIESRADTMVKFRIKKNIDPDLLAKLFCKFCYMPSDKRGIYRVKFVRNFLKQFRKENLGN